MVRMRNRQMGNHCTTVSNFPKVNAMFLFATVYVQAGFMFVYLVGEDTMVPFHRPYCREDLCAFRNVLWLTSSWWPWLLWSCTSFFIGFIKSSWSGCCITSCKYIGLDLKMRQMLLDLTSCLGFRNPEFPIGHPKHERWRLLIQWDVQGVWWFLFSSFGVEELLESWLPAGLVMSCRWWKVPDSAEKVSFLVADCLDYSCWEWLPWKWLWCVASAML